jgi:hypothetical protein
MNDTTKSVTTLDASAAPLGHSSRSQRGGGELQDPVRPMAVVMCHEYFENALKVLLVWNEQPVETFERTVRTNRSATPLACVVRNGMRTISIPSLRNTSSNPSVNFLVPIEREPGDTDPPQGRHLRPIAAAG